MAHFAEIDGNNKVLRVIVVNNNDILDVNGEESEAIGVAFCKKLLGGQWIQTSYNAHFRKNFAGTNYIYDFELDAFIAPDPKNGYILDKKTCQWVAPIPRPDDDKEYAWNSKTLSWDLYIPTEN